MTPDDYDNLKSMTITIVTAARLIQKDLDSSFRDRKRQMPNSPFFVEDGINKLYSNLWNEVAYANESYKELKQELNIGLVVLGERTTVSIANRYRKIDSLISIDYMYLFI